MADTERQRARRGELNCVTSVNQITENAAVDVCVCLGLCVCVPQERITGTDALNLLKTRTAH